jgi:TonB family protein
MSKLIVSAALVLVLVGCATVEPPAAKSSYVSPILLTPALPEFPPEMLLPGTKFHIEVNFLITPSGQVVKSFVVSAPNPAFDKFVLEALAKWIYRPGSVDGRAVNVDMQLPIDITIDENRRVTEKIGSYPGDPSPERMVPDTNPKVVTMVKPALPKGTAVGHGTVVVDFIVTSYGDVREAFVLKSVSPPLDAAALEAVKQWKFEPAQKRGKAIFCHMQVPVMF